MSARNNPDAGDETFKAAASKAFEPLRRRRGKIRNNK